MRSFGMCVNNLIDIKIDQRNPRTQNRVLAKKIIGKKQVISIIIGLFALYSILILYFYGYRLYMLSLLPVLVSTIYPYMKRITGLSHFILSSIHAMLPFGIYLCINPKKEYFLIVTTISIFMFFWISTFDIVYSKLDKDFDIRNNLYSASVLFSESHIYSLLLRLDSLLIIVYCYNLQLLHFNLLWILFLGSIMLIPLGRFKYVYINNLLSERNFFLCNITISFIFSFGFLYKGLLIFLSN